jgi:hypothetical protein
MTEIAIELQVDKYPCPFCAKLYKPIYPSGLYSRQTYRLRVHSSRAILINHGLRLYPTRVRCPGSGAIINKLTGKVVEP